MYKCIGKWSYVSCAILTVLCAWLIGEITGQRESDEESYSNAELYVRHGESFGRRRGRGSSSNANANFSESLPAGNAEYYHYQPMMQKGLEKAAAKQPPSVPYFLQVPNPQPPIHPVPVTTPKSLQQLYSELFQPEIHTDPKPKLPDLSSISKLCPRGEFFYSLNPNHEQALNMVVAAIFAGNTTVQRLNIARSLRDSPHIHPKIWYYALTRVALRDPNLRKIRKPMPVEVMPDSFISMEALESAQKQVQGKQCILVDGRYGVDNLLENELWYFREDIQLNSHHFHWHLSYPKSSEVREDRRGELFYYAHQNLLARYDAERLSNNLSRVTAMTIFMHSAVIEDAYYAHLANAGQHWTDRIDHLAFWDMLVKNSTHPVIRHRAHVVLARKRLTDSIKDGTVFLDLNLTWVSVDGNPHSKEKKLHGRNVSILTTKGVDIIGDIIEFNNYSINPEFYSFGQGGAHRNGMMIIAHAMDLYLETKAPPGPIADISTRLRDVISYRWQTYVNDIFDLHKTTLPAYKPTEGDYQLFWPGIKMVSVKMIPWTGGPPNQLYTFWNQKQYRFGSQYPTPICAKHLDHVEFTYQFAIDNLIGTKVPATIRIFLAPRFGDFGLRLPMTAQRYLFFAMDIFTIDLNPGRNVIIRNSTESAVTARSPSQNPCGWPHHLLLPKGTPDGMPFDLFVMATKADVKAEPGPAWVLCGDPLRLYPDGWPMGYPFDRSTYLLPNKQGFVPDLESYVNGVSNIGISVVQIFHRTG